MAYADRRLHNVNCMRRRLSYTVLYQTIIEQQRQRNHSSWRLHRNFRLARNFTGNVVIRRRRWLPQEWRPDDATRALQAKTHIPLVASRHDTTRYLYSPCILTQEKSWRATSRLSATRASRQARLARHVFRDVATAWTGVHISTHFFQKLFLGLMQIQSRED